MTLKSLARTTLATLRFLALVSGPIAAGYGYLAWHEAHVARQEAAATARAELEHRERNLEILKAQYEAMLHAAPERTRTREVLERLLAATNHQLDELRLARRSSLARQSERRTLRIAPKVKRDAAPQGSTRTATDWWSGFGPTSNASRIADKILADAKPDN